MQQISTTYLINPTWNWQLQIQLFLVHAANTMTESTIRKLALSTAPAAASQPLVSYTMMLILEHVHDAWFKRTLLHIASTHSM